MSVISYYLSLEIETGLLVWLPIQADPWEIYVNEYSFAEMFPRTISGITMFRLFRKYILTYAFFVYYKWLLFIGLVEC